MQLYTGSGPMKFWMFQKTHVLPSWSSDGFLYCSSLRSTAFDYAHDNGGWDQIARDIATSGLISSVPEDLDEIDLIWQVRRKIALAEDRRGHSIENICKSLAGEFGVSSSVLRRLVQPKARLGYVFTLDVDSEYVQDNRISCGVDYGYKIPLFGDDAPPTAREVPRKEMVRYSQQNVNTRLKKFRGLDIKHILEIDPCI